MNTPVARRQFFSLRVPWFSLRGFFFLPASLPGWIIIAGAVGYLVYAFAAIDARSHSVSDTLMNFMFRILLVLLVVNLVAWSTSRDDGRHR